MLPIRFQQNTGTSLNPVRWLGALALLVMAGWFLTVFPLHSAVLWLLCITYVVLLWVWPHAWLVVLPVAISMFDLAPWSGWFLVDEFDLLATITVAVACVRQWTGDNETAQQQRLTGAFWVVCGLLFMSGLISFCIGFLPYQPIDPNAWNGYYTPWNALRLAKGLVEGLALAMVLARLRAAKPELTDRWLLRGVVLGLLVFGCVVLWERGVLHDLVHARNIYGALGGLLDFATTYRITGLFSQMHLGGSAVDGYLALCSIFPMVLLFQAKSRVESLGGFVVLGLSMYAVLVTFTRGTYAVVGLAFLVYAGLLFIRAKRQQVQGINYWFVWLAFALLFALILAIGFHYGGSITLFALAISILVSGLFQLLKDVAPFRARVAVLGLVGLVLVYLAYRGMANSKYSDVGFFMASLLAVGGTFILSGMGLILFRRMSNFFSFRINIIALLLMVLALPVLVLGLMNARMEVRFSQVGQDLDTRVSHWNTGLDLMSPDWAHSAFGMGLGVFPRAYLLSSNRDLSTGSIWFHGDGGDRFLRFFGGSTRVGQRVMEEVVGPLQLTFKARHREGKKARMAFRLCQRPLLVQDSWVPACADSRRIPIEPAEHDWQSFQVTMDTAKLRQPTWYSPHFMLFSFGSDRVGTIVELKEVELTNAFGEPLLKNHRFESGLERWMVFNDFQHLPWHAKNLYLHIYLEQGILGLMVFGLTVFFSLRAGLRQSLEGDLLATGIVAGLSGFLMLGVVATLFDVPRLVTLFYLLALLPLIRQWMRPARKRRRRRHRMRRGTSQSSQRVEQHEHGKNQSL